MTSSSAIVEVEARSASGASRAFLPLLVLLFVASGCSALIYEIVWFQLLQLVIGSTGISMGVLLGTFMGGMCLGSIELARLISRRRHPLRVYAMLEIGIGLVGIFVLRAMPWIADTYTHMGGHGIAARAMLGMICLLPPTLLMGATLPAIARWVEASRDGVSWLGFFYGGNIAGAVFGCLLAGFYLLRVYDMATATYVAVGLNAAVALAALVISTFARYEPVSSSRELRDSREPTSPAKKLVYLVIALSGLTGLGAEVVWTRLLALMLGQTVYTFSIILAVFLFGLGIGSSVGSYFSRYSKRPRLALGLCQLLLAGAIGWTAFAISDSMPYWPIDPGLNASPWFMFQLDLVRCLWAVLPAAMLWGASFPLALASVSARGQDPGKLVGGVYASNTLGAIVGALAFAMLLVPAIGTRNCERVLVALALISAALVLAPTIWKPIDSEDQSHLRAGRLVVGGILASCVIAAGVWLVILIKPMPWVAVAFGRHSASWSATSDATIIKEEDIAKNTSSANRFCIYVGEGMNVSAAVTVSREGYKYFHGAGKVQASTDPNDMRLQRMLGHISALTFRDHSPKDVLVVACGAGVTAGSFIPYDSVKRIVICDIEPLVPQKVTPMFGKQNYHIVDGIDKENPHMVDGKQVQVVYDDGRHFVRVTDEKFDVITSDPIDPWVKGCAALNTVEYYQMCKQHLNPGGVMALWIPLYESNIETFKSVLETFFTVFPDGIVWSNDNPQGGYDAVLFGQVGGTRVDLDETDSWIEAHPKVMRSLREVGFGRPGEGVGIAQGLYSTYAGRAQDLTVWGKGAQLNYDSNLRLQYLAGMSLNSQMSTEILQSVLQHYQFPADIFSGSPASIEHLRQALSETGRVQRRQVASDR
jgi:spermidine synthase